MEEDEVIIADSDASHPVLIIPKNLTKLETNCDVTDDVFINVNVTSEDIEGNEMNIYSGFCNVKILDCDVDNHDDLDNHDDTYNLSDSDNILGEITLQDSNKDESEMLIDPMYNPYVNDNYNAMETEESYSVYQSHREHITVRQHSTSYNEAVRYTPLMQFGHQTFGLQMMGEEISAQTVYHHFDEELECGLFLSQLPEEIIANENRAREEMRYIDSPSDDDAVKQLMSSELQTIPTRQRTVLYVGDSPHHGHDQCLAYNDTQGIIASENRARKQMKYMGLSSGNDAVKQLMSPALQKKAKEQRTILYLGDSSPQGHTIQRIAVNDPQIKCVRNGDGNDVFGKTPKKKYQCDKCKQIFYKLATFKEHIDIQSEPTKIHPPKVRKPVDWQVVKPLEFVCHKCNKILKTREKFELHCLGHGNPDLECNKCHKVFSSKMTLKNHNKIHLRKHKCPYCRKSYQQSKELHKHLDKIHFVVKCNKCEFSTSKLELAKHMETHKLSEVKTSDSEVEHLDKSYFVVKYNKCESSTSKLELAKHMETHESSEVKTSDSEVKHLDKSHFVVKYNKCESSTSKLELAKHMETHESSKVKTSDSEVEHLDKSHFVVKYNKCESSTSKLELAKHMETHESSEVKTSDSEVAVSNDGLPDNKDYSIFNERKRKHDAIIDQVVNNELFHVPSKRGKKFNKKCCNICVKYFDRVSDLKRHLIEHIVRSTLAKSPADDSGALNIRCDVCKTQTFHKVDRYKAHLRDHARLTTYKCTFCDKTFSDSSNFSKHKKTHGSKFFQCDSCQRKFHAKKSLIQHIEYHNTNTPLECYYCDKEFHFPSSLTKHIKSTHTRNMTRYKCGICFDIFNSLKEKWDHEWVIHNVRKVIVDCLVCGSKFRKYCELKAHCKAFHSIEIPPARKLLKKGRATE